MTVVCISLLVWKELYFEVLFLPQVSRSLYPWKSIGHGWKIYQNFVVDDHERFFILSCILQIYRGEDTCFQVENLSPKSDYHLRVCAIRICEDGSEVVGAFSPVVSFTTQGHEPVSPLEADVKQESKLVESKPLTDQQWAMIILMGFVVFAVLVAIIAQQIIKYRSSSIPRWENQMFFYQFEEMGKISMDSNELTCISLHGSATRSASVGVSTHYYDRDLIQRDWLVAGQNKGR